MIKLKESMKFRVFCTIAFLFFIYQAHAVLLPSLPANENNLTPSILNVDSLVQNALTEQDYKPKGKKNLPKISSVSKSDTDDSTNKRLAETINLTPNDGKRDTLDTVSKQKSESFKIDSVLLLANPLFIELVYTGLSNKDKLNLKTDLKTLLYGNKIQNVSNQQNEKQINADEIIAELRNEARNRITRNAANLYIMSFDQLPDPTMNRTGFIIKKPITKVEFENEDEIPARTKRIYVKNPQLGPWQYKATSMAQFSESVVSPNWYQGGNSNLAVLGILSAQLSYDDKKNIQWDNTAEWRMGFNSVAGDSIHPISTNDDILRINSKLGIKAGGNFFYSGSVDFSTQFFNSFKGLNSYDLKAGFLAPVRLNIGVGLDYKYKKTFSFLISPFSYKYIYVNPVVEPIKGKAIDPNLFGIKTGQNVLSEIGSSFKATYSSQITKEIQLDSRLSFYTNYQKVEIDWEIVANMSINRFLSTRISFNPRYDNTIIEKDGSLARLQFKQFLSVGFSHKFL